MAELRWIQASLVLVLMLHVTGQNLHATVRERDDVTLNCGNVIKHEDQCKNATWMFSGSRHSSTVTLVESGKIQEAAKSRSNRLRVTKICSLVIKQVIVQDVGLYVCTRQGGYSEVDLSVVSITGPFYDITVRRGDDVTLPCGNVIHDQDQCDKTMWLFSESGCSSTVTLVENGKINEASKPVRLRVTERCSLVVEKVTHQDEGLYTCRQFDGSVQIGGDSEVQLSVVSTSSPDSEHQNKDEVTLSCFVETRDPCRHTVKWLDETNTQSLSYCSATVTFTTSQLQTFSDSLTCEVTDDGRKQTFPFRQTATTTKATTTTTNSPPPEPLDVVSSTSSSDPTKPQGFPHVLRSIMVSVALAALIISVVTVSMWTRTKGRKKQMEENSVYDDGDEVNYENNEVSSASV